MKVYRVQHERIKMGPYTAYRNATADEHGRLYDLSTLLRDAYYDDKDRWPEPYSDGMRVGFEEGAVFGFQSIGQLKEWFRPWLRLLRENDFVVAVFRDVQLLDEGSKQLAFRMQEPERVFDISELLAA